MSQWFVRCNSGNFRKVQWWKPMRMEQGGNAIGRSMPEDLQIHGGWISMWYVCKPDRKQLDRFTSGSFCLSVKTTNLIEINVFVLLDRPVAMADSHTFTPLPFSPPVKSGNQCGDLIALSKTKLVASIDAIAVQDHSIHRGWFGSLSKQSQPEQKRNSLFPKNYQKLEKWMTEECACGPDDGSMNQMEANPWNAFQSVHSAMSAVANRIEDVCPEASAHLKKKLRHAWNFLTHSKKRRQHLIELFNADSNVARVE